MNITTWRCSDALCSDPLPGWGLHCSRDRPARTSSLRKAEASGAGSVGAKTHQPPATLATSRFSADQPRPGGGSASLQWPGRSGTDEALQAGLLLCPTAGAKVGRRAGDAIASFSLEDAPRPLSVRKDKGSGRSWLYFSQQYSSQAAPF